jgi:N-acetylmuramic acid 6-phosphate etherase
MDAALPERNNWKDELEAYYSCNVLFMNAIEACAAGMSELGYLLGDKTVGVMTVDAGIGLMIWRNGRRWRPGGALTGLGNTSELSKIIESTADLYNLDEICLAGGWINVVETNRPVKIQIVDEGKDRLQLLGAIAFIIGETVAREARRIPEYDIMQTEMPYNEGLMLQRLGAVEIVELLWGAEQAAGKRLKNSLSIIADTAEKMADSLLNNGRIIYVGAGSSGRIAALDAVELPCTYGLSRDKALAVIAGGVAGAAIDIERNFEEDASAVPDMLLLNLTDKDVVIGISASGSAYFVQSALAFSKFRGAYTVMIQNADSAAALTYCHIVIPLYSGAEVVAGSTRMKAGTSTKKVLNMLSTSAMILLGKVYGSYMIDVSCINNKLKLRAQSILGKLFNLSAEESERILEENDYDLKKTCNKYFLNNG